MPNVASRENPRRARLEQKFASGNTREALTRKDQGDLLAVSRKVLETGRRFVRRAHAPYAVMPPVLVGPVTFDAGAFRWCGPPMEAGLVGLRQMFIRISTAVAAHRVGSAG